MAVYMCVCVRVCVCQSKYSTIYSHAYSLSGKTNKQKKPKSNSFAAGESDQMRLTMLEDKV